MADDCTATHQSACALTRNTPFGYHALATVQVTPQGVQEVAGFDTVDGLYDCAWSETNENILASACGDGSIKIWDTAAPPQANPLRSLQEHGREVSYAVCEYFCYMLLLPCGSRAWLIS